MVHLRTLHAKNQPPRPKTVAYRPRTHFTHRHTDRQRKQTLRTPFFEKNFFLIFDFLLKERSDKESTLKHFLCRTKEYFNILFHEESVTSFTLKDTKRRTLLFWHNNIFSTKNVHQFLFGLYRFIT